MAETASVSRSTIEENLTLALQKLEAKLDSAIAFVSNGLPGLSGSNSSEVALSINLAPATLLIPSLSGTMHHNRNPILASEKFREEMHRHSQLGTEFLMILPDSKNTENQIYI